MFMQPMYYHCLIRCNGLILMPYLRGKFQPQATRSLSRSGKYLQNLVVSVVTNSYALQLEQVVGIAQIRPSNATPVTRVGPATSKSSYERHPGGGIQCDLL